MREVARSGLTPLSKSAAVNTAATPGAACAAPVSIARMRACAWSLRRNAACSTPATCRSSTKLPSPVSRRGSSVRLMRAPTIFGRRSRAACSLLGIRTFAQCRPLRSVVAADDRCAARLDAPYFGERLHQCVGVPRVLRQDAGVEGGAHTHGIGCEQNSTGALKRDERRERTGRVAGQGDQHDATVAVEVALTRQGFYRYRMIPIGGDITPFACIRSACGFELARVHHHRCLGEEFIAAAVVGM